MGRNRTTGLRREEVSSLSGVSITWYTWLEQGRNISASRQVLEAVARTLQLSSSEHAYVLSLGGHAARAPTSQCSPLPAPAHVHRLLDALVGSPAVALRADWGIAAWNSAYEALYPGVAEVAPEDRNLLWLVFTDPDVRQLLPHWDSDSGHFLAQFRSEAGSRLGDPAVAALVERLRGSSRSFREGWDNHGIEGFASRERLFLHHRVGLLRLEHHQLAVSDHPDLHVVIYTPVDDDHTRGRLQALLEPC